MTTFSTCTVCSPSSRSAATLGRMMLTGASGKRATIDELGSLTRNVGVHSVNRYGQKRAVMARCDVRKPDVKPDDVFLTLREETEWLETVDAGWNCLVGADRAAIVQAAREFKPAGSPLPYFGDGHAAVKIADLVVGRATE